MSAVTKTLFKKIPFSRIFCYTNYFKGYIIYICSNIFYAILLEIFFRINMEDKPIIIGSKLLNAGYIYHRSRRGNNSMQYWDCTKLRQKECRARAITSGEDENVVMVKESDHDHAPDREVAEAERIKYLLKDKALSEGARPPTAIIRDMLEQVPPSVISHLPDRTNLKKTIRTARRANLPRNPTNLNELVELPEEFQKTLTGDRFLLWDSNDAGLIQGRVLVFGTRRNIELLASSQVWFLDGTFKVILIILMIAVYSSLSTAVAFKGGTDAVYPTIYHFGVGT